MDKNLIIALLPLILIFVSIDIFAWIVGGWKIGLLIPSVIALSFIITMWMNYWLGK